MSTVLITYETYLQNSHPEIKSDTRVKWPNKGLKKKYAKKGFNKVYIPDKSQPCPFNIRLNPVGYPSLGYTFSNPVHDYNRTIITQLTQTRDCPVWDYFLGIRSTDGHTLQLLY